MANKLTGVRRYRIAFVLVPRSRRSRRSLLYRQLKHAISAGIPYKMNLPETVRLICKRLAPLGWARLFARHGLKLDSHTLHDSRRLAVEFDRPLTIDRAAPGFEDFWPDGCRAIEPGR